MVDANEELEENEENEELEDVAEAREPRPALDPTTARARLFTCLKCDEPVATSAWSGRVSVKCGYCGHVDERELAPLLVATAAPEEVVPYRAAPQPAEGGRKVMLPLDSVLRGADMGKLDLARLRESLKRRPLVEEALSAVEWEQVWSAVWLAKLSAMRGDRLQARIALEVTLEATRTPAYRAVLLAHLAQHAAAVGAVKLAKKWLRACPEVAIAEIDSEVRAARAMIAHAERDDRKVQELTGRNRAGDGFVGHATWLAIALNAESHARLGDPRAADQIMAGIHERKLTAHLLPPLTAFSLEAALESFVRSVRVLRLKRAAGSAALMAVLALGGLAWRHYPLGEAVFGALVVGASAAIAAFVFSGRTPVSKVGRFTWGALEVLVVLAIFAAVTRLLPSAAKAPSSSPPTPPPVPSATPGVWTETE